MQGYFVDTWFLIAQLDKRDGGHAAAVRLGQQLRTGRFFTHDLVLAELLTHFSGAGHYWRRETTTFVRDVLHSPQYQATAVSREHFERALDLYERRLDKGYSHVDCISMHLMRERGLTHILTNDHHFSQEGFVVLSDAP